MSEALHKHTDTNTNLKATISTDDVDKVVNNVKAWLVELCSQVVVGNGHANSVADALTQWPCGDFDACSNVVLGVARSPVYGGSQLGE